MIYGYCRVSTKKQLDGNGLEVQEAEIKENYPTAEIFHEQFTGKTTERPIFKQLISDLKKGDLLVVSKLDRFCRSTEEGLTTINELQTKGVKVHILNMGLIEDTPMGKLIITNLLAFAEFERSLIVERTQAGKEIAKQNPDFRDGRPKKFKKAHIENALAMLAEGDKTVKQVSEATGISEATIYRAKREAKAKKIEVELENKTVETTTAEATSIEPIDVIRKADGDLDCDKMSHEQLMGVLDQGVTNLVEFANSLNNFKIDSTEHKLIDLCKSEVLTPLSNGFIATDGLDYFKTEDEIRIAAEKGYRITFLIDNLQTFINPIEDRLKKINDWKNEGFNYYKRTAFNDNPVQIENEDELSHLHFNIDDAIGFLESFLKNVPKFDSDGIKG